MNTPYGYIYLIKDHWNNHVYIGQKLGLIEDSADYYGSGKIIKYIIKKRKHLLEKIILGYCYSKEELDEAETECVYFYRSFGVDGTHYDEIYGYNLTIDGKGGSGNTMVGKHHTTESKIKISDSQKGEKGYWYGKHQSIESSKKKSEANKKRIYKKYGPMSKDEKLKRSVANKGKIPWNKGIHDPRLGKHHKGKHRTDEEKLKISNSLKGRQITSSEKIKQGWIKRKQKKSLDNYLNSLMLF